MAGRFTDTKYSKTVDELVQATKNKINNPYYKFSDKKPTKVTYYRQNVEKTTLDEGSEDLYAYIGNQAPTKYNKINGMFLYGVSRIDLQVDVGDYGLEANEITGTAIVLPNTVIPMDGDFFSLPYIKEDVLFKINSVTPDTLDSGANIYQLEYKLEKTDSIADIEKQVTKTYNFIVNNVGTDFNPIIEDTSFKLIDKLDRTLGELTSLYQIFFDSKVQNFIANIDGYHMYDPYLIEFMIRNKLMSNGDQYIYVEHGTTVSKTFAYDYSKTLFYVLENPEELESKKIINTASATGIDDINSLFVTRTFRYYQINYFDRNPYNTKFTILPPEVIEHIYSKEYFLDKDHEIYNVLIAYFKEDNDYINGNIMESIKRIDYQDNKTYFYLVPIYIFIINSFIESLMK